MQDGGNKGINELGNPSISECFFPRPGASRRSAQPSLQTHRIGLYKQSNFTKQIESRYQHLCWTEAGEVLRPVFCLFLPPFLCFSNQNSSPVSVFYAAITNYQKLSGLKQHSFILAHVPWVRGLGWACAQGLRRLESRHQTDDVFTWVLRERITATFFRLLGGHSLKLKTGILIFLLASHWGSLWAPEAALTACPIHRAFCSPAMWWSRPAEESLPYVC